MAKKGGSMKNRYGKLLIIIVVTISLLLSIVAIAKVKSVYAEKILPSFST